MEISKDYIRKYQAGGAAPAPAPVPEQAPAPVEGGAPADGGGDPLMALAELAMQGLQNQDCAALTQMAEQFLSLLDEAGAGAEPAPAPEQGAVFKKGGKIVAKRK